MKNMWTLMFLWNENNQKFEFSNIVSLPKHIRNQFPKWSELKYINLPVILFNSKWNKILNEQTKIQFTNIIKYKLSWKIYSSTQKRKIYFVKVFSNFLCRKILFQKIELYPLWV